MSKTTAPVVKENKLPAAAMDAFASHAGEGFEGMTAKDVLIPRIAILQDLSPQLKANKAEFIEGAKVSEICNVATGQLFGAEIEVLPVKWITQFLEWAPRSSGKGLVAIHSDREVLEACERDEKNRPITKAGNLIAETAQYFVFNLSSGSLERCFIPMTSTQLKKARKWNHLYSSEKQRDSKGNEFTPPIYFRTYKLSVVPESNNDGDWYGWRIARGDTLVERFPDNWQDVMKEAIEFRESIESGAVRGDLESDDGQEASQGASDNDAM